MRDLARAVILISLLFLVCAWTLRVGHAAESYTTQPGDTLGALARGYIADDTISPYQMMLALLYANPGAFVNNNINALKTGYVLRLPARDEILATTVEDALAEVRRQNTGWRAYPTPFVSRTLARLEPTDTGSQPASSPPGDEPGLTDSTALPDPASDTPREPLTAGTVSSGIGASTSTGAEDMARLQRALERAQEQALQGRSESEALRHRVVALEAQLTRLDNIVATQPVALAEGPQRLVESADREPIPTLPLADRKGEADEVEPFRPTNPIAAWFSSLEFGLAVAGLAVLGLALIWLWRRRTIASAAKAEPAVRATLDEPSAHDVGTPRERSSVTWLEHQEIAAPESETPVDVLADLMIDLDDLVLDPDQAEEDVDSSSPDVPDAMPGAAAGG